MEKGLFKMNQRVILVHGKKRSGKDFFSDSLKLALEEKGYSCKKFAFADVFKDILCITFGITLDDLEDWKNEKAQLGVTDNNGYQELIDFRELHQNFGDTAMKKYFGKLVWANFIKDEIMFDQYSDKPSDFIIVSDFRVPEEYIENSITVKIFDNSKIDKSDSHRTENSLLDFQFDFELDNTRHPDLNGYISQFLENLGIR